MAPPIPNNKTILWISIMICVAALIVATITAAKKRCAVEPGEPRKQECYTNETEWDCSKADDYDAENFLRECFANTQYYKDCEIKAKRLYCEPPDNCKSWRDR